MPSNYCVRLFKTNPLTQPLAAFHPQEYGPSATLAGWAANFGTSADFSEQLATFSDPNGSNQLSNLNAISFRTGFVGEADREVTFVGLIAAGSQGVRDSVRAGAIPLAVVALPGGRKRVAAAGRLDIAAGALTFQL